MVSNLTVKPILIANSLKRHKKLVRWSRNHHGNGCKQRQTNVIVTFIKSLRIPWSNYEHRWLDLKASPKWDSGDHWARRNEIEQISELGQIVFLSFENSILKDHIILYKILPNFKIFVPVYGDALWRTFYILYTC